MSETMECYNAISAALPDTGGASGTSSTLSSPCSNNVLKGDLQSRELELKDRLLNGDSTATYRAYLPNNNVCETEHASPREEGSCESEDGRNEELRLGPLLSQSGLFAEDTSSLHDNSSATESSQEPQTTERIGTPPVDTEEEADDEEEVAVKACQIETPVEYLAKNGALKKTTSTNKKKKVAGGSVRGRPAKALVPMYHSQISGDKNTIKLRIKKSNMSTHVQPLAHNKKKSGRRKRHKAHSDTDNSDYERKPKRSRPSATTDNDVSSTQNDEPLEQSAWGDPARLPEEILTKIFAETCAQEGALPTLVRLCKVCKLWRDISVRSSLWKKADLNYVKEKNRTDLRLHWLILNRLTECEDLSMGEWKVRDIQAVLEAICEHCPKLRGLNLGGWKGLNADNLKYLATECKKLERLDLSSINSTSAINAQPLVNLGQTMGSRLTHLVLAHNKIAGFMQIISALASHCPNLQLLDISNIKTFAHNTALLHVERLQIGCPKMRVLRITNSQVWLAPVTLTEQMASPGFPNLEELSLAGLEEDQTTTSRSMDDEGIERLLKSSTKLRLLDVRGCSKLTDSGLVRVPAWDLEHLFLSACYITRLQNSGLELIIQKWSHSLLEVDLAWSTATASLDAAVMALAERGAESKLRILNLCGSSVSLDPVKAVLAKCSDLHSINLQSCRALPRGIKRLYTGSAVDELRKSLSERKKTDGSDDAEEVKISATMSSSSPQDD